MSGDQRIARGPFSADASRGDTRSVERTVLVVVHHLAAATRLMDIVPLVERDPRLQVTYTVPPSSIFAHGAHEFLRAADALTIPWAQATQTRFDLAVAAGQGMLEHLHAPTMMFSHGAGYATYVDQREGHGPRARRAVNGLGYRSLTCHGRVVPAAIMLSHADERRALAAECAEAVPATVVAGDPCWDRLLAARPNRTAYRNALGAGPGQRLVVVSSRWGTGSLLGRHADVLSWIANELPPSDHRIVAILHPNIWVWHGRRQVRQWFAEPMRSGVVLLPPEEGWRAALLAGDVLIGDRGSVTAYGAALGLPVLLGPYPTGDCVPGSLFARLGEIAPRLTMDEPLLPQLAAAERLWRGVDVSALRDRLTSVPGRAAHTIRRTMYRLMRLPEPAGAPRIEPLPLPTPIGMAAR